MLNILKGDTEAWLRFISVWGGGRCSENQLETSCIEAHTFSDQV